MTRNARASQPDSSPKQAKQGYSATGAKLGRPSELTPELGEAICKHIADGLPIETACALEGVHKQRLYEWDRKGQEGIEPYAAFADARARASALQIQRRLELMADLPRDLWKREAWLLERLHPSIFAQVTKNQLSGPDGGPIQTQGSVVVVPGKLEAGDWAARVAQEQAARLQAEPEDGSEG